MKSKIISLKQVILLLMTTIVIAGCDSNNEMKEDEVLIDAKAINALEYNDIVEVKLTMFDFNTDRDVELCRVNWQDGGFTFELPKTLSQNYLYSLVNNNGLLNTIINTPPTLNINNKKVKIGSINFLGN